MLSIRAKIQAHVDYSPIVPLSNQILDEVRSFAKRLQAIGKPWQGEAFGWTAKFTPESRRKPVDSSMTFTPAEFWIGESGIWFFL